MLSFASRTWVRFSVFIFLISVIVRTVKCDFEILVLHTNDMHSRFDETDVKGNPAQKTTERLYGGFARLKKAVDDARAEAQSQNIPSVFLNAGDTFQGTAFYTMLKDEVVSSLMPLLGIEAMSLGNHEFDDGVQVLSKYLRNIDIPVVASNLNFTYEKDLQVPNLTPSITLQKGDKKIGVIGYLLPETKNTSNTGNVIFYDEIESISKEARRLKADGVNIIVALGHSGIDMDKQIAKSVPEVSLVIGGHTNTFLYSPIEQPPSIETPEGSYPLEVQANGKKVPVVQAFAFTKYLGKLWITFNDNGDYVSARPESNPQLLNSSIPEDPSVKTKVLEWKQKFQSIVGVILGRTNVHLDGWKSGCKKRECNMGNFITDAFVDAVAKQYNSSRGGWTDAAIAVLQGGALKSALNENKTHGNFTYEEVLTILPYKTPLYKVSLRGSDLRKALEHSISNHNSQIKEADLTGEFLHLAGIQVVYDVSKPVGSRVSEVNVRCANCSVPEYAPLNDKATYTVVMNQYLRDGGDGYYMFTNRSNESIMENGSALTDTDAVAEYFKKFQVNYPGIDRRITFINDELPVSPSKSSSPINSSIITLFASLSFVTWFYNTFTVTNTRLKQHN